MSDLCTHYACRCAQAAELEAMSDKAADPRTSAELLARATEVHNQPVRCRMPPRAIRPQSLAREAYERAYEQKRRLR